MSRIATLTDSRPWLPRTGQTTSYRAGDDAAFRAGRPGTMRFIDGGAGVVFDRHTGLWWVKQPELIIPGATGVHPTNQIQRFRSTWAVPPGDGLGDYLPADLVQGDGSPDSLFYVCVLQHTAAVDKEPPNPTYWRQTVWTASAANLTTPAAMVWNDAIDNSLALVYAGFSDWRLPNAAEMLSICNFGGDLVYFDVFTNVQDYHWTSSTRKFSTGQAYYTRQNNTFLGVSVAAKTTAYYVRPVRGGRTVLG